MDDLRLFLALSPPADPTDIRRFNTHVCQNGGGLWLKYGVLPLKAGVCGRLKILDAMRRFVDISR